MIAAGIGGIFTYDGRFYLKKQVKIHHVLF